MKLILLDYFNLPNTHTSKKSCRKKRLIFLVLVLSQLELFCNTLFNPIILSQRCFNRAYRVVFVGGLSNCYNL